jgi:microcystin-dependent protein
MAAGNVVLTAAGGGQPVSVVQPALAMKYCIALQGVFPPRP